MAGKKLQKRVSRDVPRTNFLFCQGGCCIHSTKRIVLCYSFPSAEKAEDAKASLKEASTDLLIIMNNANIEIIFYVCDNIDCVKEVQEIELILDYIVKEIL